MFSFSSLLLGVVFLFQVFNLKRIASVLKPLKLPNNVQVYDALSRVLRLPSVASKRYLTNKVRLLCLLKI